MRVKSTVVLGVMLWSFAVSVPVWAQQYDARRNGDVVQLEDKKNETVVSIITSVGMMAYEMKVKGQNVLRFPFKSIDDFKAKDDIAVFRGFDCLTHPLNRSIGEHSLVFAWQKFARP